MGIIPNKNKGARNMKVRNIRKRIVAYQVETICMNRGTYENEVRVDEVFAVYNSHDKYLEAVKAKYSSDIYVPVIVNSVRPIIYDCKVSEEEFFKLCIERGDAQQVFNETETVDDDSEAETTNESGNGGEE